MNMALIFLINEDYAIKNNISSLSLALDRISNSYILPCDLWCNKNPFRKHEMYSWYMVSDLVTEESSVRINRKMNLITLKEEETGNGMIGISYITESDAERLKKKIRLLFNDNKHDDHFWEDGLIEVDRMFVRARVAHSMDVVEINTYEQLRDIDCDSDQLKSDAIETIAKVLGVNTDEVVDISVLKKGMTNRSFLFSANGNKYIMRIPGGVQIGLLIGIMKQ